MGRQQIKELIIELIRMEVKNSNIQLSEEAIPRDNIEKFDSLNEVNITTELQFSLHIEITEPNIFFHKKTKLKLKDIIDKIYKMLKEMEG